MTAVCGFVQTYIQLLLARIGVGVGAAGGSPPAHSMISDIFSPLQRATALSIYSVGVYIGILTGWPTHRIRVIYFTACLASSFQAPFSRTNTYRTLKVIWSVPALLNTSARQVHLTQATSFLIRISGS